MRQQHSGWQIAAIAVVAVAAWGTGARADELVRGVYGTLPDGRTVDLSRCATPTA